MNGFCVACGPGCSEPHDDWCPRGLLHRKKDCDDDCRRWVRGGAFQLKPAPEARR